MRFFIILFLIFSGLGDAFAQHPIDVQRQSAQGEHFSALVTYEKLPRRTVNAGAQLSAAKSAWALGLSQRAIEDFEEILRKYKLSPSEQARIFLSRGMIEYQEGRYQVAALYAEKLTTALKQESPLRSHGWFLWGESLFQLGSYGAAAQKYTSALSEADESSIPDIHFRLGRSHVLLGQLDEAKSHFEQIPLGHERTPEAIRHLAEIALDQQQYAQASFWLTKGKEEYPDEFLDSWVDYALVRVAHSQGDTEKMEQIREEAEKRYPPSDSWFTLLNASAEGSFWMRREETAESNGEEQ
ncbi:MAG: tetratricopeptide repeat protein [Bdellovibrionales bacterium]|nr:tetratricopeptide repeat protein [Bdellovibrionales bacterium]